MQTISLAKAAAVRMRREYGQCENKKCSGCCNYQLRSKSADEKICIAYGCETEWDAQEKACGLYNVPFRALRPRHMPLEEKFQTVPDPYAGKQMCLF